MKVILVVICSYLFGSIPWALVIGKLFYHKDVREEGSGNLGASNAGRVLGKPVAIIVTILDALKAFFSMLIAHYVAPEAILFAGVACCIGHCFPIFAKFKGGKAVATTYGFLLGVVVFITGQWFWQFLFPIICFFIFLYMSKMVSVASIMSIFVAVVTGFFINVDLRVSLAVLLLWLLITYRHHDNINRIKQGKENKIKWMG